MNGNGFKHIAAPGEIQVLPVDDETILYHWKRNIAGQWQENSWSFRLFIETTGRNDPRRFFLREKWTRFPNDELPRCGQTECPTIEDAGEYLDGRVREMRGQGYRTERVPEPSEFDEDGFRRV